MDFFQESPLLPSNTFQADKVLQQFLLKTIPKAHQKTVFSHLDYVGKEAVNSLLKWAKDAEEHNPIHVPFDPWGKRVDKVVVSNGWKALERFAAEQGVISTAYKRELGFCSRVYQMALLYLFAPSSAFVSCPLAMTDGIARVLELYAEPDLKQRVLPHLLSNIPSEFWTGGQWMTERSGGSDVRQTSTIAIPINQRTTCGATHRLYGVKWFTSAITANVALTLAKVKNKDNSETSGLSLFYVEIRDDQDVLNDIEILRLKDKLGTNALPTAELRLKGTLSRIIGPEGQGIKNISTVLNITRLYNAVGSVAHMRRCLDLIQDYSRKRKAFGKYIIDHPLHYKVLENLEELYQRSFLLTFLASLLLGKEEIGEASQVERMLLRVLIPLVKLYTGKQVVYIATEVIESFGGAGYIEDTGIPRLLRDAQVYPIWEGTTNILCLDLLRVFRQHSDSCNTIIEYLSQEGSVLEDSKWCKKFERLRRVLSVMNDDSFDAESETREMAFTLAHLWSEVLLIKYDIKNNSSSKL
eukprot:jgi/Galph1/3319/GphlegSOOS_G1952.1